MLHDDIKKITSDNNLNVAQYIVPINTVNEIITHVITTFSSIKLTCPILKWYGVNYLVNSYDKSHGTIGNVKKLNPRKQKSSEIQMTGIFSAQIKITPLL